jgi:hypothetical protein
MRTRHFPPRLRCSRVRSKAVRADLPLVMMDGAAGDLLPAAISRASIERHSPLRSPNGTFMPALEDGNVKRPPSRVTGDTT